jgi:hypothetical protein
MLLGECCKSEQQGSRKAADFGGRFTLGLAFLGRRNPMLLRGILELLISPALELSFWFLSGTAGLVE